MKTTNAAVAFVRRYYDIITPAAVSEILETRAVFRKRPIKKRGHRRETKTVLVSGGANKRPFYVYGRGLNFTIFFNSLNFRRRT